MARLFSTSFHNGSDNGHFTGVLLRFEEGQRAVVDVHNDTYMPEVAHWHGHDLFSINGKMLDHGDPIRVNDATVRHTDLRLASGH